MARPGAQSSLAPISPGRIWSRLPYLSILVFLTLPSTGHLFPKRMPSALQGVSARYLSSWLRRFPTASSVTGRVLEVLRYVPIPAVRARIRRPRQPNVCEACFACVLDPDSLRTAGSSGRLLKSRLGAFEDGLHGCNVAGTGVALVGVLPWKPRLSRPGGKFQLWRNRWLARPHMLLLVCESFLLLLYPRLQDTLIDVPVYLCCSSARPATKSYSENG